MEPSETIIQQISEEKFVFLIQDKNTKKALVNVDTNAVILFDNHKALTKFAMTYNLTSNIEVMLLNFPEAMDVARDLFGGKYEIIFVDNEIEVG